MGLESELQRGFLVPQSVRDYLCAAGFVLPLDPMDGHIAAWDVWMAARSDFYDYRDKDSFGRMYEVHRRSLHPAMRVCREWGSLLVNEKTTVSCEKQACTDWLADYFARTGFMEEAQASVVRAFRLGTAAWALWLDLDARRIRIRSYDARIGADAFYQDAADKVKEFCKERGIDCHIKNGTAD